MKKKLLLLFILIILSGCSVTSNISINENYNVEESTRISFDNSLAVNYYSPKEYANEYIEYYLSAIKLKNYEYSLEEGSETSSVDFTKTSNDICKSINENLFSNHLYKTIKCSEDEEYFIIDSVGEQSISKPLSMKTFNAENVVINVKLPVLAEENNADIVNDKTYTWEFNKSTSSDKSIHLKISKTKVEENYKNVKKQEDKKNNGSIIGIIIFIIILIIGLLLVANILYKKYKENKLEY